MAAKHEEIRALLTGLEADVPRLHKAYPYPAMFMDALESQADIISQVVSENDYAWASREIDRIMTTYCSIKDPAA
ncbi:hypothetical protein HDE78_003031 [Rhodanobacter sp. K2T2]|uniref:hypothetical protein n=1 Tax=Rhodanobacter sp. K2T2 TaxID=2723085 RepID=UPI0015C89CAB|nr:hypothetical protein [Rhodanobacter sp. K2T2]NYE30063.1 hypothetical protein [Rhodanobacter sp. K2T2]